MNRRGFFKALMAICAGGAASRVDVSGWSSASKMLVPGDVFTVEGTYVANPIHRGTLTWFDYGATWVWEPDTERWKRLETQERKFDVARLPQ